MANRHPHSAAIKRIGVDRIRRHFCISRQAVFNWSERGIPRIHHGSIRLLATINGVLVPELNVKEEA